MTPETRFWAKVDRRGADDCWPWTASRTSRGYGAFYLDGKMRQAHLVAFALTTGVWPDWTTREMICHTCDNRTCCNPNHLYLGSDLTNAADRTARGRHQRAKGWQETHCKSGHPFVGDNVRVYVNKRGYVTRRCRACGREAQRRYRTRRVS